MHCVDYKNHDLFICCENIVSCINSLIKKLTDDYIFVGFMYPKVFINNAIRKVISLKDKSSVLHKVLSPIIGKLLKALLFKDRFSYFMLSGELHEKIMSDEDYPGICVCFSSTYYDTFACGTFGDRLKNQQPYVQLVF